MLAAVANLKGRSKFKDAAGSPIDVQRHGASREARFSTVTRHLRHWQFDSERRSQPRSSAY